MSEIRACLLFSTVIPCPLPFAMNSTKTKQKKKMKIHASLSEMIAHYSNLLFGLDLCISNGCVATHGWKEIIFLLLFKEENRCCFDIPPVE